MIFSGVGVDWGSRPDGQKPVLTFFLLVLNLLYRVGIMVLLQRKLYFSKDPEGVQHFPVGVGVQLFPGEGGEVQILFSIKRHINCDFPGGGGVRTPYPPSGSANDRFTQVLMY